MLSVPPTPHTHTYSQTQQQHFSHVVGAGGIDVRAAHQGCDRHHGPNFEPDIPAGGSEGREACLTSVNHGGLAALAGGEEGSSELHVGAVCVLLLLNTLS